MSVGNPETEKKAWTKGAVKRDVFNPKNDCFKENSTKCFYILLKIFYFLAWVS